ncbi:MAG TPA: response regulator, partial [Vicinamibacterales bacterium]|nr:response regulator [Vicinamibacterales bacterium]
EDQLFYEKILKNTLYQHLGVRSLPDARQALSRMRPAAILLDILLRSEESWTFLCQLKESPETRDIPVVVISTVNDEAKVRALGANAFALKPVDRAWLLDTLGALTSSRSTRVLIADDQDVMRVVIEQFLDSRKHTAIQAATGEAALEKARSERPDAIVLDLGLPDINGRDVLKRLKSDPSTASIPVVIVTSARLDQAQREALLTSAVDIVSKDSLSRDVVNGAIERALSASPPGAGETGSTISGHGS